MLDKVETILKRHGLAYGTIIKSNIGFRNEVYFTDKYVVKIYGSGNINGYNKELWFYKKAKPSFSPKLIGCGEDYIILERIYGTGLYHLWRDMTDSERKHTVSKIAPIIKAINEVDFSDAKGFFTEKPDWKKYLLYRIECNIEYLLKTKSIPDELATRVLNYTRDNSSYLDDKILYLVYTDLHFDNLLVTDNGDLYLIDYGMLDITPKDCVLDVWQRMLIHPFTYANEDDHKKTVRKDYVNIISWLSEYALELFSHPHVKERVNIYSIHYELDILRDYPMGDWPIERLEAYLDGLKW